MVSIGDSRPGHGLSHFVETRFALHLPAASLVAEALQRSDSTHIVDLCSGGGGAMPSFVQALAA